MDEIWKPIPIPGYEGWYEASTLGNIRRSEVHGKGLRGWRLRNRKPQARPTNRTKTLRPKIILLFNKKRYATEFGHLVCMAFYGLPPAPHYQCNHIDGNPWNNKPENLEWVTPSRNFIHAFEIGLIISQKGEQQSQAKLTEQQILEIRQSFESCRILARRYGVCHTNISGIRRGKNWAHVK